MDISFLFVYGTLMRPINHPKHALLSAHTTYIGSAWIQAKLYEIQGYPGAVDSVEQHDKVFGELYRIDDPILFMDLDDYEECSSSFPAPHEYIRKVVNVFSETLPNTSAYCYIYNWPVSERTAIKSGRYC